MSRQLCPYHPDVDYQHAWGCPDCVRELRAKLARAEMGCALVRSLAVVLRANHPPDHQAYKIAQDIDERLADSGQDYVPRSEVDAAWRKGMEDAETLARELNDGHDWPVTRRIRALLDATESAAAHREPRRQPPETQP